MSSGKGLSGVGPNAAETPLDSIAHRMGEYYYLTELCASKVRRLPLPDYEAVYEQVAQEWRGVMQPPLGDETKKKEHFAMCDRICNSNPSTLHGYVSVIFAAWAAVQVIIDHELRGMSDTACGYIHRVANEYTMSKLQKDKATKVSQAPALSDVPPHLRNALDPRQEQASPSGPQTNLVGKTIRYRDSRRKEIRECSVDDCGTSHMRGDWYLITHTDNEEEMMISVGEMTDILNSRVDH